MIMTLADANSTKVSDCRLESTKLNADEELGIYIVNFDYKCLHTITF